MKWIYNPKSGWGFPGLMFSTYRLGLMFDTHLCFHDLVFVSRVGEVHRSSSSEYPKCIRTISKVIRDCHGSKIKVGSDYA